ncbi:MAG: GntR family transcriptional regulator [Lachnospiraceae bacterium]|nr:GntR family transcriptional regulator [Lachnospiraceae bacterium]
MIIEIDFNSDEALYIQIRNQIIQSIATEQLQNGQALPSVRQLAEEIGINMHTVNKAYTVLKQDGFVKLDRRKGAIIAIDFDKLQAIQEMSDDMAVIVAKAICKNISRQEAHEILDKVYSYYGGE